MSKVRPTVASSTDLSKEGDLGDDNTMLFISEMLLGIVTDRLVARNDLKQCKFVADPLNLIMLLDRIYSCCDFHVFYQRYTKMLIITYYKLKLFTSGFSSFNLSFIPLSYVINYKSVVTSTMMFKIYLKCFVEILSLKHEAVQ